MKRIQRLGLTFFLSITVFLPRACSRLQQTDPPIIISYPTSSSTSYFQPASTFLPSSTPPTIPSATPIPTFTPIASLFSLLQNGDYIVISKRLDGCDRIGPGCTGLFVFSQDGEEIGTLYSGDYVIAYASLSPNGHEIAFLDPPGYAGDSYSRLVVVDLITLEQKDVITLQKASGNVVWSSDGLSVLVTINGNVELIDIDSSERRAIIDCLSVWDDQKATDCEPLAWSPDNKWIVINVLSEYSGPQDPRQGTYLMSASCINDPNTCPSQVVKISDIISSGAAWSPAGESLALGDYLGEIYVYQAESANTTHLANVRVKFPSLSWSPDGQLIAFAGSSQVGFIAFQTGLISYLEVPNIGEFVYVLFWIQRDSDAK